MKVVTGDLLRLARQGKFDVIIHGCNCFCSMGAGIAKAIKDEFPEALEADRTTVPGDKAKLGSLTMVKVQRPFVNDDSENLQRNGVCKEQSQHNLIIVNAYTQYHWEVTSPDECLLDYDALRSVFRKVKSKYSGSRIAYPKIGAGLAGGDWKKITDIIDQELEGEDHTYVEFKRKPS